MEFRRVLIRSEAGDRVVDVAALASDFRTDRVNKFFLSVIHDGRAGHDPLRYDGAGGQRAIDVEYLDPVVVADTRGFRVVLAKPHRGSSAAQAEHRSEEHTSELQSLMRISYAVFCLKKKTTSSS